METVPYPGPGGALRLYPGPKEAKKRMEVGAVTEDSDVAADPVAALSTAKYALKKAEEREQVHRAVA